MTQPTMTRDRTLLVTVAVLLIAGFAWYLATSSTNAPLAPLPDPTAAAPDPNAATTDAGASGAAPAADRTPVTAPEPAPSTPRAPDAIVVSGRCVHAGSGQPLAGCDAALHIEPAAEAAVRAVTALDGTFELHTAYDAWTDTIALHLTADGFVPRAGRWPRPAPDSVLELGDIPMVPAITVTGIVVDQEGAPIADAGMMFVDVQLDGQLEGGQQIAPETMLRTRSGATGQFAFPLPAYPAEWWIGVEDTGALIEPRSVKLTAEQSQFALRVVVERPDPQHTITGSVVDTHNQPLADIRVTATGEGFIGRGRSGADGRFTVPRAGPVRDDGKPGTLLSCTDAELQYERIRPVSDARIAWGSDGVEVVMQRRAAQTVRVIDARGEPVTDYALLPFRGRDQLLRLSRPDLRGPHADGRCELTGLQSGDHAVVIVPRDARLASTAAIAFAVDPTVPADEVLVTLQERVPVECAVTDPGSRAMAGSTVELLQSFTGKAPTAASAAVALADCDKARGTPDHARIAAGTTDGDGIARFTAPPGSWTLRVLGDAHVPWLQPVAVTAPNARLFAAVEAAATLRGHLEPPAALQMLQQLARGGKEPIAVILTPSDGKALPAAVVAADGQYQLGGIPPGEYAVALRYWLRTGEVRTDSVHLPVTTMTLTGTTHQLPIDVAGMLPGQVGGRVLAGGEPLRNVHCFLRRNGPGPALSLRVGTDVDGRYTGVVPPGDYGFAITYPIQPGPGWLHMVLPDAWSLSSGEHQERNFDVLLRRIRVRLLDAGGNPIANQPVKVEREGYFLPGTLATDASGEVEIFPAPVDAFELAITVGGAPQRLGPIDLPTGQSAGEVTVRAHRR